MSRPHFLLVTFPGQGHINPALQFAKRLISIGVDVSFATSIYARRRISKIPMGITFSGFSDGYDDGFKRGDDVNHYMSELKRQGSETLSQIIMTSANQGRPVTCLIYTLLLPWAASVAREYHVPSALLWIQPAAVLDLYYYYFKGYGDIMKEKFEDPSSSMKLPGLPLLFNSRDLPSLFNPKHTYLSALQTFEEHIEALCEETNPKVLVNTFDALEQGALTAINQFNLISIGPLIPSAFLDGRDPTDTAFGGDLFQSSKDYIEWLNSKPKSSVIYISFGSLVLQSLSKEQMEEIGRALLETQRPFLWVIKAPEHEGQEKEEDKLSFMEELEQLGMIVPWCSQVEVLSHPSLGCFLTHCGWNSTLESLVSGLSVVAFPQFSDQLTNAKLVQDAWKTGVRVNAKEKGIVGRDELKRCFDIVMGCEERGEEMRKNATKWKDLARQAVKEGGSSDRNLKAFVDEVTSTARR